MKENSESKNYTYILECSDGSLYCGWTNNPPKRLAAHNAGTAAKYTRARRPVKFVYLEECRTKQEAMSREFHIKKMTRSQKLGMIKKYEKEKNMSKVNDFLSEAGVFFLATADGSQPKLRPLGAHLEADGKIIFGVGDFKDVYKQMTANPLVEIVACKPDGHWLRYTGRAVFETDPKYSEQMIKSSGLEAIYNEQTGNKLMTFHLEDAAAVEIAVMGEGVSLL